MSKASRMTRKEKVDYLMSLPEGPLDKVVGYAMRSKYTWVIMLVSHLVALVAGALMF